MTDEARAGDGRVMRVTRARSARWTSSLASGVLALSLSVGLGGLSGCQKVKERREELKVEEEVEIPELDAEQTRALGAWVAALAGGGSGQAPAILHDQAGGAYVGLRQEGKLLAEAWGKDGRLDASVEDALSKAMAMVEGGTPDTVELDLAHGFRSIKDPNKKNLYRLASGKRTGIRGLELSYGEHYERTPPTKMLAEGERFGSVTKRFFADAGIDHDGFVSGGGQARVFEAQQFLISLPEGRATKLLRGNVYVEPSAVTKQSTQETTDLLIDWMLAHLHEDGRMTYMWYPSTSAEKPNDNNMIRQWMATNALIKVAEQRQDPQLWARIAKNIDYNLEHFYRQEGELGLIEYSSRVKLGAMSLAAMAIINHPERARWQAQEHGLRRTIASMWTEEGMFECFYKPKGRGGRNGNVQNFYPGETLLFWAQLYRESRDPELLRRFVASYRYYKDWHLDPSDDERRRPSFVPWHSQANFILWETLVAEAREGAAQVEAVAGEPAQPAEPAEPADPGESAGSGASADATGEQLTPEGWPVGTVPAEPAKIDPQELVDYTFEMNDWLIESMEVWEESFADDEKGRFYSRKVNYGVPHASATGVYIEGLIDAYEMAKRTKDEARRARYALAISRGIRSVMQIQFVDEIDMYYVTNRELTRGGLRTAVLRNEVRVDNVQHVLMGVLKALERFEPEEFKTEPG